jgi:hypothetical protein
MLSTTYKPNHAGRYQIAKFGLEVPRTPQQVLWGSDKLLAVSEGCKTTGMEKLAAIRKYERVWVIFTRGTCSYTVKTKVAQSIGASGACVLSRRRQGGSYVVGFWEILASKSSNLHWAVSHSTWPHCVVRLVRPPVQHDTHAKRLVACRAAQA